MRLMVGILTFFSKIIYPNWSRLYDRRDIKRLALYMLSPENNNRRQASDRLRTLAQAIQPPGSLPAWVGSRSTVKRGMITEDVREADQALEKEMKEFARDALVGGLEDDDYDVKTRSAEALYLLYRGVEDARIGDFFDDAIVERINRYVPREYVKPAPRKEAPKPKPAKPPVKAPVAKSVGDIRKAVSKQGRLARLSRQPQATLFKLLTQDEPAVIFEYSEVKNRRGEFPWIGTMPVAVNYGAKKVARSAPVIVGVGPAVAHPIRNFVLHSGPFLHQRVRINREPRRKMYELSGNNKLSGKYIDFTVSDLAKLVFNPVHYGFPEGDIGQHLTDFVYVMDFNDTLLDPHLKGFKLHFHRAWEEADRIRILHFEAQRRDRLGFILEESGGRVDRPELDPILEDLGEKVQMGLLRVPGSEVAVLLEQAILLSGADPEKVVEMISWGAMDPNW